MGAARTIAWRGLVRRWRSGLVLAALLMAAGAVALTALAGARRTDSAYERLTDATNHPDLLVTPEGDATGFDPTIVEGLPGVAAVAVMHGFATAELQPDGTVDLATAAGLLAPADELGLHVIDRPIVLEGRLPDPGAADEIAISPRQVDDRHRVGSVVDTCLVSFDEVLAFGQGILEGTATREQQLAFAAQVCAVHHFRIVGVMRFGAGEVVLRESSEEEVFAVGSLALARDPGRPKSFSFTQVRLEDDADLDALTAALLERAPPDVGLSLQASALRDTVVHRTLEPYVLALGLFGAVAAVAALGVLGPSIVRWAGTDAAERAALLAIGVRPRQLRTAGALKGAILGAIAAIGATSIAVASSGRFPTGIARQIEPDPGLRADPVVLGSGAVVLVVAAAALGAAAAAGVQRASRPSRVVDALQAGGLPPRITTGVRAAVSRDGAAGVVRAAAGITVAIAAVVMALTYQAGLARLLDTPERYGWSWDAVVDGSGEPLTPELLDGLAGAPTVTGVVTGHRTVLLRDGAAVHTFAFERVRGGPHPTILAGRAPRDRTEIALGGQTLDRLGAALGDELAFRGPNGTTVDLTVVGQTLLPFQALGQDLSVAEGGLVDPSLADVLGAGDVGLALVDLAPGEAPAALAQHLFEEGDLLQGYELVGPTYTADLRGYDAVRDLPLVLAGVLALLGLGVLAHTVVTVAHRRRAELAVLRTLGFRRADVSASVRWCALTIVGLCAAAGLVSGTLVGRSAWRGFASTIGVAADPLTPAWPVAAVVAAALAGAAAIAVVPGRAASSDRPAAALRRE